MIKYFFGGNATVAVIVLALITIFLFREGAGFFGMNARNIRVYRLAGLEYVDFIRHQVDEFTTINRTLNDVRETLANWEREYNCERPHSSLDYRTPEEFRQQVGYADVESKVRFPHPHNLDHGDENKISKQNLNWETPVMNG